MGVEAAHDEVEQPVPHRPDRLRVFKRGLIGHNAEPKQNHGPGREARAGAGERQARRSGGLSDAYAVPAMLGREAERRLRPELCRMLYRP